MAGAAVATAALRETVAVGMAEEVLEATEGPAKVRAAARVDVEALMVEEMAVARLVAVMVKVRRERY